jgi:hypothetical protein
MPTLSLTAKVSSTVCISKTSTISTLANSGVRHEEDETMPSSEDYGDMHTNERPEDDDEETVDKCI